MTTSLRIAPALAQKTWATYLLWVAVAAVLGFAVAAIFAGVFHLPRSIYLVPYFIMVGLLLFAFDRWSGESIGELLRHNWIWGLVGAVLVGMFTVNNILSQPASSRSQGLSLIFDLIWAGALYGLADALLLSVLPVLATWRALASLGLTVHWWGKIVAGIAAMVGSLLVTLAYHFGYPEYRVAGGLVGPAIGNMAMSLGYVVTSNPIAAMFSHMAMHIAGVLQGPATVLQLPPH